jgi:hypothetical protein
MADPPSYGPESVRFDEPQRAPTFVQIRPPAETTATRRMVLGLVGVGITFVALMGWAAHRFSVREVAPIVPQPAAMGSETPPPQPVQTDPYPELVKHRTNAAVSAPVWSQQTLMDRISPFDPSVPDRGPRADANPSDKTNATDIGNASQPDSYEALVHLGKGDTIGGALLKLGFEAEAVADAVSALARHVSLKRLPIGLGMKVKIRRSEQESAKPVLQALTIQPEGREITVERNGKNQYVVVRSTR